MKLTCAATTRQPAAVLTHGAFLSPSEKSYFHLLTA